MRTGLLGLVIGIILGAAGAELWGAQHAGISTYATTVTSDPPGAFVYVNGQLMMKPDGAPFETPIRLSGLHRDRPSMLELRKPGFKTESRTVSSQDSTTHWTLLLKP